MDQINPAVEKALISLIRPAKRAPIFVSLARSFIRTAVYMSRLFSPRIPAGFFILPHIAWEGRWRTGLDCPGERWRFANWAIPRSRIRVIGLARGAPRACGILHWSLVFVARWWKLTKRASESLWYNFCHVVLILVVKNTTQNPFARNMIVKFRRFCWHPRNYSYILGLITSCFRKSAGS